MGAASEGGTGPLHRGGHQGRAESAPHRTHRQRGHRQRHPLRPDGPLRRRPVAFDLPILGQVREEVSPIQLPLRRSTPTRGALGIISASATNLNLSNSSQNRNEVLYDF